MASQSKDVRLVTEARMEAQLADPDFKTSIKGDTGPAPVVTAGTTTQVPSGAPAEVTITSTGEGRYRADFKIPRGLDGDPSGVADLSAAMASEINTEGSAPRNALNAASVEAVKPFTDALDASKLDKAEAAGTYVTMSPGVREFVRTSDPAVVAAAGEDQVVFFEGRPGVEDDFTLGVQAGITPIWAGSVSDWEHVEGTVIRRKPAGTANANWAAVPSVATGQYGDVDVVARVRYSVITSGLKAGIFVRGGGTPGSEMFIYAAIQTQMEDADAGGGLRLNVSGVTSIPYAIGKTAVNATWRNQENTWYNLRLRAIGDTVMAKQWLATDPEPAAWDLTVTTPDLPPEFRTTGVRARGMVGMIATRYLTNHDYDHISVATDGAVAPVKP